MDLVLDPKTTALVLIDLQRGIVGREVAPHTACEVIERSAKLAAKWSRLSGGTIIYVRVLMSEAVLSLHRPMCRFRRWKYSAAAGGFGTGAGGRHAARRCGGDEAAVGGISRNGSGAASAAPRDSDDCVGWAECSTNIGVEGMPAVLVGAEVDQ